MAAPRPDDAGATVHLDVVHPTQSGTSRLVFEFPGGPMSGSTLARSL
ncbi:hypothetical protein OPIT5_00965 [Opitutaceae bacterium TAV5]|nr:hypothetical protein OPIT5_00965 [Opitutaceae bacterium TAV5]